LNIPVLALFGSATEQDHKRSSILAEIDSVAGAKISPALIHACTNAFRI
jgi:hypothetical protein